MAITQTTRFQVYRWGAATDAFTRQQMDDSHANIEALGALFTSGTLGARPAAAASNARGFYLDTDNTILYWSDGSTWRTLNSYAAPSSTLTPGDGNAGGAATTTARSDHTHAMLAFAGSVASIAAGSGTAGAATTYSRGDHTHPLADSSVVAGKIATGGVSAADQLGSNVVTTDKILDSNVTRAKIASTERTPVGAIFPYAGTTEPSGWLFCNGQQVTSGSDLGVVLGTRFNTGGETVGYVRVPDFRSRMPYGPATMGTSIGTQTGAATATLAETNLPSHTHSSGTIAAAAHSDHTHGVGSYANGLQDLSHTHSISHDHASFNTGAQGSHQHTLKYRNVAEGTGTAINLVRLHSSTSSSYDDDGTYTGTHNHDIDIPSFSGTSGSASVGMVHGHTISGSSAGASASLTHSVSGSTGSTGSGTAFSIIPPSLVVNFIIKI